MTAVCYCVVLWLISSKHNSVRLGNLLNNPFVFKSFWDSRNGRFTEEEWQARFPSSKRRAAQALGDRETAGVLGEVFNRLYSLRNQLSHGGATWGGKVNRE